MKLALVLFLCLAVTQASPQRGVVKPRHILFPESALFPRMTGSEYEALLKANQLGNEEQIETADSKIIGGENAESGQFPWQVSITMDSSYFCGGSIISDSWVLTAGHCGDGVKSFALVFGSLDPDGDSGSVQLTSRTGIVHEKYNSQTIKNDIALVKLPSKLTWSDRISPVRLPRHSQESETFVGEEVQISGWGKTSDSATSIASRLKWTVLSIAANSVCANTYGNVVTATNICATGKGNKATCNGDSGGPLVLQENDGQQTQVGIVSFGAAAGCEEGYPDCFTRVTSFLVWIGDNTDVKIQD